MYKTYKMMYDIYKMYKVIYITKFVSRNSLLRRKIVCAVTISNSDLYKGYRNSGVKEILTNL